MSTHNERCLIQEAERSPHWRSFYPRIYPAAPPCGRYGSPKIAAAMIWAARFKSAWFRPTIGMMCKYSWPTIWLSEDVCEAIKRTTPPVSVDLLSMELPFPALTIMLPEGAAQTSDGNLRFVAYSRITAGERIPVWSGNIVEDTIVPENSAFRLHVGAEDTTIQTTSLTDKSSCLNLSDLDEWQNRFHACQPITQNDTAQTFEDLNTRLGLFYCISVALLLADRPDLLAPGKLQRKVAQKRDEPKEFWTPSVLGENYRIRRERGVPGAGEHSSPRMHWVRGFWRNQPYGSRDVPKYRLRWIEPFIRGAIAA